MRTVRLSALSIGSALAVEQNKTEMEEMGLNGTPRSLMRRSAPLYPEIHATRRRTVFGCQFPQPIQTFRVAQP